MFYTLVTLPSPTLETTVDIEALRRQFHSLHSSLRDEGHNPLEAVSLLANALAPNGHAPETSPSLDLRAALVRLGGPTSAGVSVAFQQFMVSEARNGLGQYLTPLPVAELIGTVVAREKPRTVLDPFAGSGLLLERLGDLLPDAHLFGIEINPAVAQLTRATSRLARHPIDLTEGDAFLLWATGDLPRVDAVVTNPPFGSVATRARRDDLAKAGVPSTLLALVTLPAELLGLELSVAALQDGGFLAIVLPQSVLTNNRWAAYRADLFERIQVEGVVSLPEETFSPFKGVAKACVLLATKRPAQLPTTFPYIRSRSIGYDDTGRPAGDSDLVQVAQRLSDGAADGLSATISPLGQFLVVPAVGELKPEDCHLLRDVAEVFTGRTLGRNAYVDKGPRILKVGDLSGSFIAWRNRKRTHVPPEVYGRTRRAKLLGNDICLTAAAHKPRYIGLKVDLVDELPPEGAMASAEVLVIRLKPRAPFGAVKLLYYLRSETGYRQLQDLVRGSTAHLYPADVAGMLIPPLENDTNEEAVGAAFWRAAKHYREYLRHEAEATALALPNGSLVAGEDEKA